MIKTQKDIELIQNILKGDPKAQEILYKKYTKSVKNFLKNKYSTYHDLDDDVSEIMIKVFMKLNIFDETKSKFRSWVFSIAKNYVIDKWRCSTNIISSNSNNLSFTSNNSDNLSFTSNNSDNLSFTTNYTSSNTDNQLNSTYTSCNNDFENCSAINYVLGQLTPQEFTLLDMKYIQGYDYNEIGKEFNVTSSTISNKVNYIKTKLKKNNLEIIYE